MDTADVFGVGIIEAMSTVISSLGNVGPGLGAFGPAFSWAALPDAAKWILSFLMLIGRLELFAVLLLFYSGFGKDDSSPGKIDMYHLINGYSLK